MWNGPVCKVLIFCTNHRRTVQPYVRPVSAVITAGHYDIRDADRLTFIAELAKTGGSNS